MQEAKNVGHFEFRFLLLELSSEFGLVTQIMTEAKSQIDVRAQILR
jgi:hypothetical protein